MTRALRSSMVMLSCVKRGLLTPRLLVVFLGSLVLWSTAYQYKSAYVVDIGGLTDDAYVNGFHAKEQTPEMTYRWSRGVSAIELPGTGNQPVNLNLTITGYRPSLDAPKVTIETRGQRFEAQTSPSAQILSFFVDRGDRWDGDIRISLTSPAFSPAGDPRELGVLVDSVEVVPADFGLRPFVIPPLWVLGSLLLGLVFCYLCCIVTLQNHTLSLAIISLLAIVVASLIVFARPELGLLAKGLPGLMTWTLCISVVGRIFLDVVLGETSANRWKEIAAIGSAAAGLAFLLRFGGMTYPQFLTSDLLLHAHNVQSVMRGDLLLIEKLPDGTPVPYPPALYLLAAPLALVFGSSDESLSLVLKWLAAALDSTTCIALAWAGARTVGGAGALAALVYALSPGPFELMSAGNHTNIFGQSIFNLTMLGGMVYLGNTASHLSKSHLFLLATGFFLTALGHYGMMLSTLLVIGLFVLLTLWAGARRQEIGRSGILVGTFAAGLVPSLVLFYGNFVQEVGDQFTGLFERMSGGQTIVPDPATSPAAEEALHERFGRKLARLSGTVPLLAGTWALLLAQRLSPQPRNLLISWLAAAGFFFLLDQALGDAIRWYYLAAAPIAMLVGWFFSTLATRGKGARTLVTVSFGIMLLQLLYIWVGDLIFTRYH